MERTSRAESGLLPSLLTNNQLKIFALVTMTADHVGLQLLPQYPILRIIGRLAFPVFAYMIAEGCRYTKDRRRYLLTLGLLALAYQLVYLVAMGSLYQGIFVTFTLSTAIIFSLDRARERKDAPSWMLAGGVLLIAVLASVFVPMWTDTDFAIDYDIWGILLPVVVYYMPTKEWKLAGAAACLTALAMMWGGRQWFSLLALIPLACYNGKRGKGRMKNLFYIYYPAHLAVIYLLDVWI